MDTSVGQTTRVNGLLRRLRELAAGGQHDGSAAEQAREQELLDELLSVTYERLRNLTRKMFANYNRVRPLAQTEDVLHPALVKLLDAVRDLRPADAQAFVGLAALQIRRTLLDLVKRPTPPLVSVDAELAHPPSSDFDSELWTAFHEAIPQLPEEERLLFEAYYYVGWTQARIAEEFTLDPKTVAKRLRNAKRGLVRQLRAQGFSVGDEF